MFLGRGGKGGSGPVGAGPGAAAKVLVLLGLLGSETVPSDFDRAALGRDGLLVSAFAGGGMSVSCIGLEIDRGGI